MKRGIQHGHLGEDGGDGSVSFPSFSTTRPDSPLRIACGPMMRCSSRARGRCAIEPTCDRFACADRSLRAAAATERFRLVG